MDITSCVLETFYFRAGTTLGGSRKWEMGCALECWAVDLPEGMHVGVVDGLILCDKDCERRQLARAGGAV